MSSMMVPTCFGCVKCSRCGRTDDHRSQELPNVSRELGELLRERAAALGWVYRGGRDLCPRCKEAKP